MSTVFVQVGQCGNQVGKEFYKTVSKLQDQRPVFAGEDEKWKSVNVDSEAKVVNNLYRDNKKWLRESNIICGKHGRGTNWAMGYHGIGEDNTLQLTLEALRREVERCDSYCGTVVIHSLSGGTGSGLGSHLCESIKDEYPLAYLLSSAVAPHASGESPLQHYNCILSLGWLQRFSDGIVLFQNDEILRQQLGLNISNRTRQSRAISFADMNSYIGDCLAGIFLPLEKDVHVKKKENSSGICTGNEAWEMLRSICPMPAHKLVHITCLCKSKSSWESITDGLVNKLKRYDRQGNPFVSLANLAVIRGDSKYTFSSSFKAVEDKLKLGYNCVRWNPFPIDFWTGKENLIGADESSLTVCANTSSFLEFAQHTLDKAKVMHSSRAYLHWYQQFGCDESCFVESFQTVENIIQAYEAASSVG